MGLDTDGWATTCKAMGGTRIVLTAKHSCGFLAWRTKTAYNYSVAFTPDGTDVVAGVLLGCRLHVFHLVARNLSLIMCGHKRPPPLPSHPRIRVVCYHCGLVWWPVNV